MGKTGLRHCPDVLELAAEALVWARAGPVI